MTISRLLRCLYSSYLSFALPIALSPYLSLLLSLLLSLSLYLSLYLPVALSLSIYLSLLLSLLLSLSLSSFLSLFTPSFFFSFFLSISLRPQATQCVPQSSLRQSRSSSPFAPPNSTKQIKHICDGSPLETTSRAANLKASTRPRDKGKTYRRTEARLPSPLTNCSPLLRTLRAMRRKIVCMAQGCTIHSYPAVRGWIERPT